MQFWLGDLQKKYLAVGRNKNKEMRQCSNSHKEINADYEKPGATQPFVS
jgi:hypothetical protein